MRLFHVSEEMNIRRFEPRLPSRKDMDPNTGLVWAISEDRLSNFLTPRDCPRVGYHVNDRTTAADRVRFFADPTLKHALVLENKWLEEMRHIRLYLYEFDPSGFTLQDSAAGYYVATTAQIPIEVHAVTDAIAAVQRAGAELHVAKNLWPIAEAVKASSLDWSLCRMAYAQPPK